MRKLALALGGLVLASTCPAQNWVQVTTKNAPGARWSHALAYDFIRGHTIVFGGTGSSGSFMNDTWAYDGKDWTQIQTKTSPPGRRIHKMVGLFVRGKIILFGGGKSGGGYLNDTWEFDGSVKDWKQIQTKTLPPARWDQGMTYDSVRNRVVMFGGFSGAVLNDTWEFDGTDWTKINTKTSPPARATEMAYDSTRQVVVMFGGVGGSFNDTWEYDGKDWKQIVTKNAPSARSSVMLVYDADRKKVVLFGGFSGFLNDTWEYDGKDWTKMNPKTSPPGRYDFDFGVYDSRRTRVVMYGGLGTGGTRFNDTWEYVGSQPLTGTPATISIASGGTQTFALDAGTAQANRLYWIFGSVTGTTPGVNLSSLAGTVNLPLNPDFWTDITIALANSPLLTKTRGALDGSGKGSATLNVPKITNQSAIGVKFYHAFLVYDAQSNFYMASNPVELTLAR